MEGSFVLEELVFGNKDSIEIIGGNREKVIDAINSIMLDHFENFHMEGKFIEDSDTDYLTYDIKILDRKSDSQSSHIRLVDFGNKVRITRIRDICF